MTFPLTQDRLQSIAVGCVSKFMSKEASLSEAIAKEAQDLELNSDQTKRVIEASNTIAYLRQLEKAADRTFEFEVADYGKVMSQMCMPEDMSKEASDKEDKDEDKKDDKKKRDKNDEGDHEYRGNKSEEREEQEKKAMLMQGYMQSRHNLQKMAYDKTEMHMTISNAIATFRKDPYALEKLAFVAGDSFEATVKLCGIEKRAEEDLIFTDRELATAKNLVGLYKQASEMIQQEEALQSFIKRAEAVLFPKTANVTKLASFGEALAMGAGRAVGSIAGGTARAAGNGLRGAIKAPGAFARASADRGFTTTKEGVKAFDQMAKTKGTAAASAAFKGAKPSFLLNRVGLSGIATALAGSSMDHKNNIKDL